MGSHIDVFMARVIAAEPIGISAALEQLARDYAVEHESIAEGPGGFHPTKRGWSLIYVAEGPEPAHFLAEGPAGLSIDVFEKVILFSSVQRFFTLYDGCWSYADEDPVIAARRTPALRRILEGAARILGDGRLAVAAGGGGDTDAAADLAYYQGASFEQVCSALERQLGPGANAWSELDLHQWGYFVGARAS
jgi:hypothetical protein